MTAAAKRPRKPDPLASRQAVARILARLRAALPDSMPAADKQLVKLLRAVVHAERQPQNRPRRGRKSPWQAQLLTNTGRTLRTILARETKTVGLRSFVEHYLLIPGFPVEVAMALENGEINLFEAEQLSRLVTARTGVAEPKLRKRRKTLLQTHLQTGASGMRLKARVEALLNLYQKDERQEVPDDSVKRTSFRPSRDPFSEWSRAAAEAVATVYEAEPDHLFYEYLHLITALLQEIRPAEISEPSLARLTALCEQLIHQLNLIYKSQNPPPEAEATGTRESTFHI